jgi:hypothetical protein
VAKQASKRASKRATSVLHHPLQVKRVPIKVLKFAPETRIGMTCCMGFFAWASCIILTRFVSVCWACGRIVRILRVRSLEELCRLPEEPLESAYLSTVFCVLEASCHPPALSLCLSPHLHSLYIFSRGALPLAIINKKWA